MKMRRLLVAPIAALVTILTVSVTPALGQAPVASHIISPATVKPLSGRYSSCIPPVHMQRRNSTTIEVWVDSVDFRNTYYEGVLYVTLANSRLQPISAGGPWYVGPTQGFDKTFTLAKTGYVGVHLTDADTAAILCVTDVQHI